jgi:hypothetical protein
MQQRWHFPTAISSPSQKGGPQAHSFWLNEEHPISVMVFLGLHAAARVGWRRSLRSLVSIERLSWNVLILA